MYPVTSSYPKGSPWGTPLPLKIEYEPFDHKRPWLYRCEKHNKQLLSCGKQQSTFSNAACSKPINALVVYF